MTPQEKTKYLISINTLAILSVIGNKLSMIEVKEIAKQCTIIAVDEILNVLSEYTIEPFVFDIEYWQEVKQESEQSK